MEHELRAGHRAGHRFLIAHVAVDQLHVAGDVVQVDGPAGREVVQDANPVTRSSRACTRFEPMNPAPPVTTLV